eukprot:TRINITY_DN39915_c0_g1_i1.p1 TRINITY_DN39915_c0_g1~~TRINITY_DN39915_c0_g1_i1.p1  ORF type:complete len:109 (-),score=21.30 TRINITY_DN39915_c0_g1_i1:10-336(-)
MIDGVNPSSDEMDKFNSRMDDDGDKASDDEKDDDASTPHSVSSKKSSRALLRGDRVVVTDGDMAGLTGRIVSVLADSIQMKPDHKDVQEIGRAVQQECRDRSRMPSSA